MEEIFVPALGMASDSVYLTDWLKQPGERVEIGDVVATIETDKADLDIESTAGGTLGVHRFAAGSDVPSGATITVVLAEGESEQDDALTGSSEPAAVPTAEVSPEPARVTSTPLLAAPAPTPSTGAGRTLSHDERARDPWTGELEPYDLSPRARAAAQSAPAAAVAVLSEPVAEAVSSPSAPPRDTATPETRHRDAVAGAVSRSWSEIPHFAVTRELRVESLLHLLRSLRAVRSDVTVTDLLVKAFALGLVDRVGTREIHLGLAVATDRGVAIPVLKDVARADVFEIAEQRRGAVERALAHRLAADDADVPHSTLSNLGAYGVDSFTGIIPVGQTSILTVGVAAPRPVVDDGALAVATTLTAVLNVDHRVWDGQHAAEVLARLAAITAEPLLLGALR